MKTQDKKLLFYSVFASVLLLSGGFVYNRLALSRAPEENLPQKTAGIFVGDPSAPVLIEAYGSFLCPACRQFTLSTYPQLEKDYILTGKAKMEFFFFPPYETGQAALCAQEQDKFPAYQKIAYGNQGLIKDIDSMVFLAEKAGLDKSSFKQCLESNKYQAQTEAWHKEGLDKKITGTPTFFIQDEQSVIPGSYDYSFFQTLIDSHLNEKP